MKRLGLKDLVKDFLIGKHGFCKKCKKDLLDNTTGELLSVARMSEGKFEVNYFCCLGHMLDYYQDEYNARLRGEVLHG